MIYILYKHEGKFSIGTYHRVRPIGRVLSIEKYSDTNGVMHHSSHDWAYTDNYTKINRTDIISYNKELETLKVYNPEYFV